MGKCEGSSDEGGSVRCDCVFCVLYSHHFPTRIVAKQEMCFH